MIGLLQIYEENLKKENLEDKFISYDYNSLTEFINKLEEINLLIYENNQNGYSLHDKQEIKEEILIYLNSFLF